MAHPRISPPHRSLATFAVACFAAATSACSSAPADDAGTSADAVVVSNSILVQAKSYIAWVNPNDPPPAGGSSFAYNALVTATNAQFNENPPDGSPGSGGYRLFGTFRFDVRCDNSRMIGDYQIHDIGVDAGWEGPVQGYINPLRVSAIPLNNGGGLLGVDLHYVVSGRPNPSVEPTFQAVLGRSNAYIFQETTLQVRCRNGIPVVAGAIVGGSQFPSHKVWISDGFNGGQVWSRPQGAMNNLWSLPGTPGVPTPGIGVDRNGWGNGAFLQAYNANGGGARVGWVAVNANVPGALGSDFGVVHEWPRAGCFIQNFNSPDPGANGGIMWSPAHGAWWMRGQVFKKYVYRTDTQHLGCPTGPEQNNGSASSPACMWWQDFEGGRVTYDRCSWSANPDPELPDFVF